MIKLKESLIKINNNLNNYNNILPSLLFKTYKKYLFLSEFTNLLNNVDFQNCYINYFFEDKDIERYGDIIPKFKDTYFECDVSSELRTSVNLTTTYFYILPIADKEINVYYKYGDNYQEFTTTENKTITKFDLKFTFNTSTKFYGFCILYGFKPTFNVSKVKQETIFTLTEDITVGQEITLPLDFTYIKIWDDTGKFWIPDYDYVVKDKNTIITNNDLSANHSLYLKEYYVEADFSKSNFQIIKYIENIIQGTVGDIYNKLQSYNTQIIELRNETQDLLININNIDITLENNYNQLTTAFPDRITTINNNTSYIEDTYIPQTQNTINNYKTTTTNLIESKNTEFINRVNTLNNNLNNFLNNINSQISTLNNNINTLISNIGSYTNQLNDFDTNVLGSTNTSVTITTTNMTNLNNAYTTTNNNLLPAYSKKDTLNNNINTMYNNIMTIINNLRADLLETQDIVNNIISNINNTIQNNTNVLFDINNNLINTYQNLNLYNNLSQTSLFVTEPAIEIPTFFNIEDKVLLTAKKGKSYFTDRITYLWKIEDKSYVGERFFVDLQAIPGQSFSCTCQTMDDYLNLSIPVFFMLTAMTMPNIQFTYTINITSSIDSATVDVFLSNPELRYNINLIGTTNIIKQQISSTQYKITLTDINDFGKIYKIIIRGYNTQNYFVEKQDFVLIGGE